MQTQQREVKITSINNLTRMSKIVMYDYGNVDLVFRALDRLMKFVAENPRYAPWFSATVNHNTVRIEFYSEYFLNTDKFKSDNQYRHVDQDFIKTVNAIMRGGQNEN